MTEVAVRVEGLVKDYGDLRALDRVDLSIGRGEIFGLIGPNGAGKTTLIRALVGALRPSAGSVWVLGHDPLSDRWRLRGRLGYMPQAAALYDDLTARGNVAFFAAAHVRGDTGGLVDDALGVVELADRAGDRVHVLSGGMRQRLSLACALVHRPELLLLDEPTSGVDPELRAGFWDRFRALAADGVTIVVSTHQMPEALSCDRVAILRAGQVVALDDPRRLLELGRARVRIWRQGALHEEQVDDYRTRLPALLASGPPADRVEVEPESLDDIVLRMIRGEG